MTESSITSSATRKKACSHSMHHPRTAARANSVVERGFPLVAASMVRFTDTT